MGYSYQSLFFLLGWNLLCCDAYVTVSLINSANGVDSLECRSIGVVSCHLINSSNGIGISWNINDTPFADCKQQWGCRENPSFPRHSSTYDDTTGVSNLTVEIVTFDDNSTTFKCDDGYSHDSITIEVVPAYSENNTNINDTAEGKQVEFTTACVQPGVEFEWFTVKTDNSDRNIYSGEQNDTTEATLCSHDSECGGVGRVKVSSIIKIPTVSNGELHYLGVVVKYKNPDEERTFRFDEKFHFKGSKFSLATNRATITFVGLLSWILVTFFELILLCLHRRHKLYSTGKSYGSIGFSFTTLAISVCFGFPFIGIIVKGVLVIRRMAPVVWSNCMKKTEVLKISKMVLLFIVSLFSLVCEGVAVSICLVWSEHAWYALIPVCLDLVFRGIVCIKMHIDSVLAKDSSKKTSTETHKGDIAQDANRTQETAQKANCTQKNQFSKADEMNMEQLKPIMDEVQ